MGDRIDIGGVLAGGATTLTSTGDATIGGSLDAAGALGIHATGGISIPGTVSDTGSTFVAGGAVSIAGSLTSGAVAIMGDGIDIGGVLAGGATTLTSSGGVTIGGSLDAASTIGIDATGGITIPGTVRDTGSTFAAGGAVSIAGSLISGAVGITADGIDIGGVLAGGATQLTSSGGVTIGGSLDASGALGINAANGVAEAQGGRLSGATASLSAAAGNVAIDGALAATGALTLTAGADISQGAASSIVAGSADLFAPDTITLAGSLAAQRIQIGDAGTRNVVWNGNTIRTGSSLHGATNAIDVSAPLTSGNGVFVQSAGFQQLGNSFVDPLTGTTATLQITIQGQGTAHFDNLLAPGAQLLLVLDQAGKANGAIDVAGLNVFHSLNETPAQAADFTGVVGGRTGTAAAGVGFSHLISNINYQINGCPIQSLDCILLSPVVVPVVDPVTDYAEDTQRRRHSDDDALPNVGEEDY
jgi:hypothetical protein